LARQPVEVVEPDACPGRRRVHKVRQAPGCTDELQPLWTSGEKRLGACVKTEPVDYVSREFATNCCAALDQRDVVTTLGASARCLEASDTASDHNRSRRSHVGHFVRDEVTNG
jgi:hypothetical protein